MTTVYIIYGAVIKTGRMLSINRACSSKLSQLLLPAKETAGKMKLPTWQECLPTFVFISAIVARESYAQADTNSGMLV